VDVRKIFILCALIVISYKSYAANIGTSYFVIDKVRLSAHTGNAYIDPVGAVETINDSCAQRSLYAIYREDPLFKEIYSTALSAAASGKQIKVWVSDEADDCLTGFQKVRVIEVDF
jgi:hypothetical protein